MAASGAWDGAAEMAMMYCYARARRIRVVLLIQTALLICASVLTSKYIQFFLCLGLGVIESIKKPIRCPSEMVPSLHDM